MTDTTEQKALALVNEVRTEYPLVSSEVASNLALCRAIERHKTDIADLQAEYEEVCKLHEAFRQEVSDALIEEFGESYSMVPKDLHRFIIAKPDPLVEALDDMTDTTEQEALALFNEVARERGATRESVVLDRAIVGHEALFRAIERDKAFRQEVSDAVEHYRSRWPFNARRDIFDAQFGSFIIAKPLDPLAQAWREAWPGTPEEDAIEEANVLLAAIEKRGGKIVWGEG